MTNFSSSCSVFWILIQGIQGNLTSFVNTDVVSIIIMFNKPFRVKSYSQIKSSDRKKLRADLSQKFPKLTEEQIQSLIPLKDEMRISKICAHNGTHAFVYYKDKTPIFFEIDKTFFPTVYTLWTYPNMLHKFYTWPNVLEKLAGGADLMLPGIVLNDDNYGPDSFGSLQKNDMCCVCLVGNDAPIAVGVTLLSSSDMFESGKRGKGVAIKHVYSDQIWASGSQAHPPQIESQFMCSSDGEVTEADNNEAETEDVIENVENLELNDDVNKEENVKSVTDLPDKSPVEQMDELLLSTFLCAWKTSAKKLELPVLTSTFYRSHMLPCCPTNSYLDIKKSSYKKLSKFLKEMEAERIIIVKELSKGVESITDVDMNHPSIQYYRVNKSELPEKPPKEETSESVYVPPEISELYFVNAALAPLFSKYGYSKGSHLTGTEVRKIVTEYVKDNELQDPQRKRNVKLDPILTDCALNKSEYNSISSLSWEDLNSRLLARFQVGYQLVLANQKPIIKKGKLEPIDISIAQRSGNKKVTLVSNLVTYGIDPAELAHKIQIGVATSSSVIPTPENRKDGPQVLIQGNQVKYLASVLIDEYQLPRKWIKGLELAGKKRK